MSLLLNGKVIQGTQAASGKKHWREQGGTICVQRPFFARAGVNFRNIYSGTINVSVAPHEFRIQAADYYVPHVYWAPNSPPEDFSFVNCEISSEDEWHEALLYYPHPETKIGIFPGHSVMEILTAFLPSIDYGKKVRLQFSSGKIEILSRHSLCT